MIIPLPTHLFCLLLKKRQLIYTTILVQRVFYITCRGSTSMVNFVLQSQMLGASYLLYLNSATDDIDVDGPPPAEVGLLGEGNSTTLAEIAHRRSP